MRESESGKMSIYCYTAISGPRDKPRTDIPCHTEYNKFREPVLNAKIYKVLPHLFFPDRDVYIWMDANIWLTKSPGYYVEKYLRDADVALIKHPFRNSVHEEVEKLRTLGYYPRITAIEDQIEYYDESGFHDDRLYECNVIIRRNNHKANQMFEEWWAHITRWQYRDQISMPVVAQRNPRAKIRIIAPSARTNPDFLYRKHKDVRVKISVIIVTYGKWGITKRCLDSLFAVETRFDYEVIVVDNGSKDNTVEELKKYPGINVYVNPPSHFSKGCNTGAVHAKGQYLLFLNNDTIIEQPIMKHMEGNFTSKVAIVGAKCVYPDRTIQHCGVAVKKDHSIKHIFQRVPEDDPRTDIKREYQCVTAACMMMRKDVFQSLQGFSEKYLTGWEDIDLCLRAGKSGYKIIYEPDARIIHIGHQSEGRGLYNKHNKRLHMKRWKGKLKSDIDEILETAEAIAG